MKIFKQFILYILSAVLWTGCVKTEQEGTILPEITPPEPEIEEPLPEEDGYKIVGYIIADDWEFEKKFKEVKWEQYTHINISFLHVNADGSTNDQQLQENLPKIVKAARAKGCKVLVAVSSATRGSFQTAISRPESRKRAVQEIIRYTQSNGLDGFDIDYEEYQDWDRYRDNLTAFAKELRSAKPKGLLMTCAVNPTWLEYGKEYPTYYDLIHVMSYDGAKMIVGQPAQHASYEDFMKEVDYWRDHYGVPTQKIIGGVPFYGISWSMVPGDVVVKRYSQIIEAYGAKAADTDQIDETIYNSRTMMERKCNYIKDNNYGGIMIWQVLHDSYGQYKDYLLIDRIYATLKK